MKVIPTQKIMLLSIALIFIHCQVHPLTEENIEVSCIEENHDFYSKGIRLYNYCLNNKSKLFIDSYTIEDTTLNTLSSDFFALVETRKSYLFKAGRGRDLQPFILEKQDNEYTGFLRELVKIASHEFKDFYFDYFISVGMYQEGLLGVSDKIYTQGSLLGLKIYDKEHQNVCFNSSNRIEGTGNEVKYIKSKCPSDSERFFIVVYFQDIPESVKKSLAEQSLIVD